MASKWVALIALLWMIAGARAGELVVTVASDVRSAVAEAPSLKLESPGRPEGKTVRFEQLLPDTPYDLTIRLVDGSVLVGVDLSWRDDPAAPGLSTAENANDPATPPPEPLTDADREAIRAIVQDVPSFYDRAEVLMLAGDHSKAVALVQLIRDRPFNNGAAGEVIWRVERYPFRFQAGGWEKVQQRNTVLRRQRFASREEFDDEVKPIKWLPELGGVRVGKDEVRKVEVGIEQRD